MDWIQPMEPILSSQIPFGQDWVHQIKWDGIRGLSYINQSELRIYTKKGNERTSFYPELEQLPKLLKATSAILDGEMIVLDDENKPSFELILARERVRNKERILYSKKKNPIHYIVFDLLYLNGKDLTKMPLSKRREILVKHLDQNEIIAITDNFTNGEMLYSLMREKGWEGIVSKHAESLYYSGKYHREWFKTKLQRKMLVVIGGITLKGENPNSLLLGIYRKSELVFVGKASLGLKQMDFQIIKDYASKLYNEHSSFIQINETIKDVIWFKPALTCWVQFFEWTVDGQLRHPKILGFSPHGPNHAIGKEYVL